MQESIVNFNANRFNDGFSSHSKVNKKSKTFLTSQLKLNFGCVGLLSKIPERRSESLSFSSLTLPELDHDRQK